MPKVTPKYKQESFDKMLRRFRNQCERAGIVKRVREKEYYVKPNQKKHKRNQEMKRTRENNARKQAAAEMRRKQTSMWR
jgi:small subunit ribosomal protein S21